MDVGALKKRACDAIDAASAELLALSQRIHDHPEVAFEETQASAWLVEFLRGHGFDATLGVGSLPTAFRAVAGANSPAVAILAEYDALPGIGHGCGHNIIATTAAGAGLGVASVLRDLPGTVQVVGTPAEEVYGGKAIMIREGAFEGIDAAIMTHPGTRDAVFVKALACSELTVEYHGREAHAAAQPERGVNALEALIIAYNAINSLRQHIRTTARIHGIITDGGKAPNIVPGHAAAGFLVRAEDDAYLADLKQLAARCFEAGATATGARLELRWNVNEYSAMNTNQAIARAHRANLARVGRDVPDTQGPQGMGSTDMGNVSRIMPAIHPLIAIAPPDVNSHSPEFAVYAASDSGKKAVIDGAKALAMTAIDILADAGLRDAMRDEFAATRTA
jgi:amidohydrolase